MHTGGRNRFKGRNGQFHKLLSAINRITGQKNQQRHRRPGKNHSQPHVKETTCKGEKSCQPWNILSCLFFALLDVLNYGPPLASDMQHVYPLSLSNFLIS